MTKQFGDLQSWLGKPKSELIAAASCGVAEAQYVLAMHMREGRNRDERGQSLKWLTRAAESGLPQALHELATMYDAGADVLPNPKLASELYRRAAARGYMHSQYVLACQLESAQRFLAACRWFRRAATQGHAGAQYRLSQLYQQGLGTKKDTALARQWLERAGQQGYALGAEEPSAAYQPLLKAALIAPAKN